MCVFVLYYHIPDFTVESAWYKYVVVKCGYLAWKKSAQGMCFTINHYPRV